MREHVEVASERLLPTIRRRGLSVWITEVKRRLSRSTEERLEVVERLAREERHARRTGEYTPDMSWDRPWC
jgi:hypothetical protein